MKYLLDTCVLSELIKNSPSKEVIQWISQIPENDLYISVFTFGEIHKGVEKLEDGRKKNKLHNWVNNDLNLRFKNRILFFDLQSSIVWGKIQAHSELKGKTLPLIDGLIASVAISKDLIVATRNTKDMEISGATLFNPWLD